MSTEFQEPEEKELNQDNDAVIIDDFNPLDEAVLEKEYTKHNVTVNPKDFIGDIPEPSFTPPPISGNLKQEEKVKREPEPFIPEMKDLPKKDKNDAAQRVAEVIMTGYEMLNQIVDNSLLFNKNKLEKLQQKGELDLSITVPMGDGQQMSVAEFVDEYNEQTKGTIVVTPKFKDEVIPLMTKVLAKRGIGMSDESQLAFLFIKDGVSKAFLFSQSYQMKSQFLNMWKEHTQLLKNDGYNQQQQQYTPPPQQQYTPPPQQEYTPPPQPKEEYVYQRPYNPDTNVNDFVNQMTGSIPENIEEENYEDFNLIDDSSDEYVEPSPEVKITETKTKKGKRGRPKKK
jgi:hypothetical protein